MALDVAAAGAAALPVFLSPKGGDDATGLHVFAGGVRGAAVRCVVLYDWFPRGVALRFMVGSTASEQPRALKVRLAVVAPPASARQWPVLGQNGAPDLSVACLRNTVAEVQTRVWHNESGGGGFGVDDDDDDDDDEVELPAEMVAIERAATLYSDAKGMRVSCEPADDKVHYLFVNAPRSLGAYLSVTLAEG